MINDHRKYQDYLLENTQRELGLEERTQFTII